MSTVDAGGWAQALADLHAEGFEYLDLLTAIDRLDEVMDTFRKLDRNADGDVSRSEYVGTRAEFDALDTDGDGLISLEEAEAWDKKMREKDPEKPAEKPKPERR